MSFWEQDYAAAAMQAGDKSAYISAEEKKKLFLDGSPIIITGVTYRSENNFGTSDYVLTVKAPTGPNGEVEDRKMTFAEGSGVESRDNLLEALVRYFAESENLDLPIVSLTKVGNAWLIDRYDPAADTEAPFS
jgi:hypothetical protein